MTDRFLELHQNDFDRALAKIKNLEIAYKIFGKPDRCDNGVRHIDPKKR